MKNEFPSKRDLYEAMEYVQQYAHRTPILSSGMINEKLGCTVYFKSEHLQKTGSFKARGALNALLSLKADIEPKGVVTHSSGNHGQALAWASNLLGIAAVVVVPRNAPTVKVEAIQAYGAEVFFCEPNLESREEHCFRIHKERGYVIIPPFDDYRIIAGQSTMMQEILGQIDDLDCAIVPVGGGGLLSGSLLAAEWSSKELLVFGAEPSASGDAMESFKTGVRVRTGGAETIADGLRTALGERNFEIISKKADGILPASEDNIKLALKWIYMYLKQAVEPSAAVSLAAILENAEVFRGKKVVSILCGGNLDLKALPF
jgi:threonine dehydratase